MFYVKMSIEICIRDQRHFPLKSFQALIKFQPCPTPDIFWGSILIAVCPSRFTDQKNGSSSNVK